VNSYIAEIMTNHPCRKISSDRVDLRMLDFSCVGSNNLES
jgi:hypothetical protein